MAFPYIFESNWEQGDASEWDSETDTASQLSFPHYSDLARFPGHGAPFNGAYCMRAALTGGTADAFVSEGDLNVAADAISWFRFHVYFSKDFDATADDTVHLFELQGAANAIQAVLGFRYVAATDAINFGIGELAPTSFTSEHFPTGQWYCLEMMVELDDGGTNDGTIDLYITPEGQPPATVVAAAQVASLDQIAVTHGVLGVQNHLATTTGVILFDGFIQDDLRVYPAERWPEHVVMTKSGHVFVGDGTINNVTLLSGAGTDNVLRIFDTDTADTNRVGNVPVELKNTANNETVDPAGMPANVHRGAYVDLAGTNPRALVQIRRASSYGSDGAVRSYGLRR